MRKSLPLLASVMIFAAGCAQQPLKQPQPAACPAPPALPPLQKLPQEVTGPSFLDRLDLMLFPKPTVPIKSDFSLQPASGSMKLRAKP